jgi:hypothetical protein
VNSGPGLIWWSALVFCEGNMALQELLISFVVIVFIVIIVITVAVLFIWDLVGFTMPLDDVGVFN